MAKKVHIHLHYENEINEESAKALKLLSSCLDKSVIHVHVDGQDISSIAKRRKLAVALGQNDRFQYFRKELKKEKQLFPSRRRLSRIQSVKRSIKNWNHWPGQSRSEDKPA